MTELATDRPDRTSDLGLRASRGDETDLTWRVLGTLNLFRLLVAVVLLGLFFAASDPRFFGDRYPEVFAATAAGYHISRLLNDWAVFESRR